MPIFFFPVFILAVISGAFFGLFWGSIYTMAGAMINCTLMFYIAKFLGKDLKYPKFLDRLKHLNEKNLFISFCILRLLPVVPYNVLNYIPAMCNINFKTYILSSCIGFLPWTPIFVNIGVNSGDKNGLLVALLITIIATLLSIAFAKKYKNTWRKKENFI